RAMSVVGILVVRCDAIGMGIAAVSVVVEARVVSRRTAATRSFGNLAIAAGRWIRVLGSVGVGPLLSEVQPARRPGVLAVRGACGRIVGLGFVAQGARGTRGADAAALVQPGLCARRSRLAGHRLSAQCGARTSDRPDRLRTDVLTGPDCLHLGRL